MKKLIIILLSLAIISTCLVSCGKEKETGVEVSNASLVSEESGQESVTDENSVESQAQNSSDDNSDISSDDSSEENIESEANESIIEESEANESIIEESKAEESSEAEESETDESSESEESKVEESSETEDRKLNDMSAAELLNYAYIQNASLKSFTATTSNKMAFDYAGESGSYKYDSVTKAEALNGTNPKFSCESVTSLDDAESKLTQLYNNGYLYCDNGSDKYKTSVSASQMKGLLNTSIGAADELSGNVFKTIKKSSSGSGWLVTGTGLVSGSMNGILDELLSSFNLGVTASDIKLDTFTVDTYINSDGFITCQNVNFNFTMEYSGINLKFNTTMKTEYSALDSTKVNMTVNPGDYTESK